MKNHRILFLNQPQGKPENACYQHGFVCLAEGLEALGVEFRGIVNYWKESCQSDYLLQADSHPNFNDYSVVVIDDSWFLNHQTFPDHLWQNNRNYVTVYLDSADGKKIRSNLPQFQQFDLILKTHYNTHLRYNKNIHPWAFGISNRILNTLNCCQTLSPKIPQLLVNFRLSHPVRKEIQKSFIPELEKILPLESHLESLSEFPLNAEDRLQWEQSGRRHNPHYYQRLKNSLACACFGGYFVTSFSFPWNSVFDRLVGKLQLRTATVIQWDSWRWWESLASSCVSFHVDFDRYGLKLPVQPINGKHYIGVDLDNPQHCLHQIQSQFPSLETIGANGRQWAIDHYSPLPTAKRFLTLIDSL